MFKFWWLQAAFVASNDDAMDEQFVFQLFVVLASEREFARYAAFYNCCGEVLQSQTWVGPDDHVVSTGQHTSPMW